MAHFSIFIPRIRYTNNGGMRFLRIGRLIAWFCHDPLSHEASFRICRAPA